MRNWGLGRKADVRLEEGGTIYMALVALRELALECGRRREALVTSLVNARRAARRERCQT
jgi:hypothetical protein